MPVIGVQFHLPIPDLQVFSGAPRPLQLFFIAFLSIGLVKNEIITLTTSLKFSRTDSLKGWSIGSSVST